MTHYVFLRRNGLLPINQVSQ
ncbi:hypothetical protein, partial [Staphylococcus muscae]